MTLLYEYDEFIFEQELYNSDKLEFTCIFSGKIDKNIKLKMFNNITNIENNIYLIETNIKKIIDENHVIYDVNFKKSVEIQNINTFNLEQIVKLYNQKNTTNLNDDKNNILSIKLWKNNNSEYYAGVSTSYKVNKIEYDFIIVGGGPSGIYSTYKIAKQNPNSKILIIEQNEKTLEDYILKGYDKMNKWSEAQIDSDFQKSYLSNDNKTIWVGEGLGGGTLHFGLQYVNNITKNYEEWINNYKIIDNDLNPFQYIYEDDKPNKTWFNFKKNLDNYSLNNNIDVYNNGIYGTNNTDRLLLGNLLKDLKNVEIIYEKKIDKIIFENYKKKNVKSIKTFDDVYYQGKNVILCCGAIETPSILQRSNINCGNKLYDHGAIVGLSYGKLNNNDQDKPVEKDLYFILSSENLKYINDTSNRFVFSVTGMNLPNDEINNIYDFTEWANNHPGGSYNIKKWRNNDNNLIYPHNSIRWISSKSNFVFIGKKDQTIKYDNLPDNLKSDELFNILKNNQPKNISLETDLGFEPNKIISHLQTRDKNLNWQTYYSTFPNLNNLLILTHSQSTNIEGKGSIKIKSYKNENPNIILNHFGDNKNNVIKNILEAYNKNHQYLLSNGYILINPNPIVNPINEEYIANNLDSIYHYHGSCAIGDVVDENQKVYDTNNLFIGDISVLNKPWGGSTSYAALNTGFNVSKNFL